MSSAVKLIAVRPLLSPIIQDEVIWLYQSNEDFRDDTRFDNWIPYVSEISSVLEQAFKRGEQEISIDMSYRIDFVRFLQVNIDDPSCQLPIRRYKLKYNINSDDRIKLECARQERLSFPLNVIASDSTSVDTFYHGSQFIRDWVLTFTDGALSVTFDAIFPVLIKGLKVIGDRKSVV